MSIIDSILLLILAGFVFYGVFHGLIRTIGAFFGVLIGAILASRFYLPVSDYIDVMFFGYNNIGRVGVFFLLFSVIDRLVGFAFYLLEKSFNIISIIPFLKTINRLGGLILGFITGSFAIGLVIYVINKYAILDSMVGRWLTNSELAPFFLKFADYLLPVLPEFLKKLQSLI
ncbi:hypothetical protein C0583_01035 [Candidatus Parcubacteria bacterium]|nr:MAG: hypothetical protein C0583_01035 [Candidatus Parcubacteria bacterium]